MMRFLKSKLIFMKQDKVKSEGGEIEYEDRLWIYSLERVPGVFHFLKTEPGVRIPERNPEIKVKECEGDLMGWLPTDTKLLIKIASSLGLKTRGVSLSECTEFIDSVASEGGVFLELTEQEERSEDWPELDRIADEWLRSPELLSHIDRVIHHHLVGETKNALTVFFNLLSALTPEPANLRPTGESAIGKSFLVTRVARLFPPDMVIVRKGFSDMAVWNKAEPVDGEGDKRVWDLRGKAIIVLEESTCPGFLEQFRPILGHDEECITYEVTDRESKNRETLKVEILGWPAYIGLQVGGMLDEQEETRAMTLTPDSGREKYSKAIWWDAYKSETPWLDDFRGKETEIARLAIGKLKSYRVLIPQRGKLQKYFPRTRKRHMRDWKNFRALVEAVTILHQYQRPMIKINSKDYLISAPCDVEVAIKVAEGALSETLAGLDSRAQRFWQHIRGYEAVEGYRGLLKEYEKCFGEGISESTIRRKYVEPLKDKGLLEVEEGGGRKPSIFFACGDLSTISTNFEKLISAASDGSLKGSTFDFLYRTTMDIQADLINCKEIFGSNPVKSPSMADYGKVWDYLKGQDVVRYNESVLGRSYAQDYGFDGSKKNLVLLADIKSEKEEESSPSLEDITGATSGPLRNRIYDVLWKHNPKDEEFPGYFPGEEYQAADLLLKMKERGEAFLDDEGRWRLNLES